MNDDTKERWLPVVNYEGLYEVSSYGNVRGIRRTGSDGRNLKQRPDHHGGHLVVFPSKNGIQPRRRVHHLVLEAFVGPRPPGKQGLHWDDDPTNNHLWNLRWGTPAENFQDRVRLGTDKRKWCFKGLHKMSGDNILREGPGGSTHRCRACRSNSRKARYAARKKRQNIMTTT